MKKFLSLTLVLAMLAAMLCIPTFAATLPDPFDIPVKLGLSGEVIHKYSVDIEYGDMTFKYNASGSEWNVSENGYSYSSNESSWTTDTRTVTIYNHSDLAIGYTVTMVEDPKYKDALDYTLTGATHQLAACTTSTPYGTIKGTVDVTVSGSLPSGAANNDPLGTLKVTFTAIP